MRTGKIDQEEMQPSLKLKSMFSIVSKEKNGFSLLELRDDVSGTAAAIIPACGAILHSFCIEHDGEGLNVIDSYESKTAFENELESKGFKGSKLSPFVCRLNKGQFHYGQEDYTIKKFYLGEHAIHGLIYDAAFDVIGQRAGEEKAEVELQYQYEATDSGYPFHYTCAIKYRLEKNNSLSVITSIINTGDGIIPIADGWHPYFTFGGSINDCQLEFQSKEIVAFDDTLIPTGKVTPYQEFGSLKNIGDQFFDNCFTVNFAECQPMVVFRDPAKKLQLEVRPAQTYPYLQIYTPDHRNSIAIENLSAAPDAFNNGMGLKNLEPGEQAVFETTYSIKTPL